MNHAGKLSRKYIETEEDDEPNFTESCLYLISLILFILTFPLAVFVCLLIMPEYERAIIFRLGRLKQGGPRGPGLVFVLPCIDIWTRVDLRTISYDVPAQEILSRDSVTIHLDAVVYYRIVNPLTSVIRVQHVHEATKRLAQTTLRNIAGTKQITELLAQRDEISRAIAVILDKGTEPWGVKVERVEIKDVRLPLLLQRAMAAEAEAAREAKAKVVAAEGELSASKALKEAADVIAENPIALQLRYLQTLTVISGEKNKNIIFPFPINLVRSFINALKSGNNNENLNEPTDKRTSFKVENEKLNQKLKVPNKISNEKLKVQNEQLNEKYLRAITTATKWENNEEIKYFREYLRIPSVHPQPDYTDCIKFLKKQAEILNLPMKIYYPANQNNPIVVLTWKGSEPELPSILLNSHMDVVPVFKEYWTYPPFGAEMDSEGRIYARGTQDMKCVGMQYLAAIRALRNRVQFKRTVHISFVADEEMGGRFGMRPFVHTNEFKALNIGFAMDEGLASPNDEFTVFYAERSVWRIYFQISGTSGHGSLLLKNTAGEKLLYILNQMMAMREHEVKRLQNNPGLAIGDVTTINLTRLSGGVQSNVVPPLMMAGFDVRLAIEVNHTEFEAKLHKWCEDIGGGIELEYEQKRPRVEPTATDESNPYWMAFKGACDDLGLQIKTEIFAGGTDSRYIREVGIPALGFSPMNNTPVLLHDHDEFIQADIYLRGIDIYKKIIQRIANV